MQVVIFLSFCFERATWKSFDFKKAKQSPVVFLVHGCVCFVKTAPIILQRWRNRCVVERICKKNDEIWKCLFMYVQFANADFIKNTLSYK